LQSLAHQPTSQPARQLAAISNFGRYWGLVEFIEGDHAREAMDAIG